MSCLLLFLLMIITTLTSLPPIHASSNINATTIKLDSNITASSNSTPWTSPSGDFSFGFLCPKNNNKTFIVAIVYPIVPFQSTAWFARTCPPVPAGSILALKPDGFVLLDDSSNQTLLCRVTGSKLSGKVSEATLSDSGNLILSNGYSTIWESFKNPTDTILPGQSIDINTQLVSKKSESDFSEGRFYARMTENGNFTLSTKPVPSNADFYYDYYTSPSSGGGSTRRLSFDEKYNLYVGDRVVILHSNLTSLPGHYFRATLEFDGTFSLYYFAKDLFDWAAAGTLPENACLSMMGDKGSGACGFNNVCYLEKQRPTCNCTKGFSLVDESNVYGDCKSSLSRNCGGKEEEYSMVEVKDVDWPLNDYEQIAPSTFRQCRMACNDDYFCEAAIYRSKSCWKKRMPLSNGRLDRSLGATAFLKVRKGT